ncbi:MAG: T9SS type A sorting domain-containing protein [Calditrichaceae bacterium]
MAGSGRKSGRYWERSTSEFTTILYAPTNLALQINDVNAITLNWTDKSRREGGYIIERIQSPQTVFSLLDTLEGSGKQYTDTSAVLGQTYTYRINAFRDSILSEYSNEASILFVGIQDINELPTEYSLSQNYPNPFNPTTTINFALPKSGLTKIIVYDLLGRKIQTLINKKVEVGYHSVNFDASDLPGGIYFYRIKSGYFTETKRMLLIK